MQSDKFIFTLYYMKNKNLQFCQFLLEQNFREKRKFSRLKIAV